MDLPKDGLGRKNEGMEEGGREGGQIDDDDWGPRGKLSGQGRRCGRPRPADSPRSFVDDWMDSHSSANVNKAMDGHGTDRTAPL